MIGTMTGRAIAAALVALTGACAATLGVPAGSDSVDASYRVGGGTYDPGGLLVVAATVREVDGQAAICGAYAGRRQNSTTEFLNREVLSAGKVSLGDETLIQNLTYFSEAPRGAGLVGRTAACRTVGRAWSPGDEALPVAITIPNRIFGGGASGPDDSEPRIRFRETPIEPSLL